MGNDSVIFFSGLDVAWPADNKRDRGTTLIRRILPAAPRARRLVIPYKFLSLVVITIIQHRSIVAGQDNNRILLKTKSFQCIENLPYAPVELGDGVTSKPHGTRPTESFSRESRDVDVIGGEIQEKRLIGVLLDEPYGMSSQRIRNSLILPKRSTSTFHVADTSDAIDYRHVMPMT